MFNFTSISNRAIGKITFDAVTSEDHVAELTITENPIESGAMIADHAVVRPKTVTINGVVVDHDNQQIELGRLSISIRGLDFLNQIPLPMNVVAKTQQTIARATRVLSNANYVLAQVNSSIRAARALAPWLPDFGLGDSDIADGRVAQCYADLLACQKSGQTVTVQTGLKRYENMLLESIAVNQAMDGSATFTITVREVFIVETKSAKTNNTEGANKSGRAAKQSAPKAQKGTTQPSVEKKPPSFLHEGTEFGKRAVKAVVKSFTS